jgi:hypothetical protein
MDPIGLHLIDKGVKPVHVRPYTVPISVEQQLRTEIARLVDIGVLEEDYASEWASPTFAIAKKNGSIRAVSDFRKLNSFIHSTSPISYTRNWRYDQIHGRVYLSHGSRSKYGLLPYQIRCRCLKAMYNYTSLGEV